MNIAFQLSEERVVEVVAVSSERYCEACVPKSMSAKFGKAAVKCRLSATETHS
jgi:hypothetical protein